MELLFPPQRDLRQFTNIMTEIVAERWMAQRRATEDEER